MWPAWIQTSSYTIVAPAGKLPPTGAFKNGEPILVIIGWLPLTNVAFSGLYQVPYWFFFQEPVTGLVAGVLALLVLPFFFFF